MHPKFERNGDLLLHRVLLVSIGLDLNQGIFRVLTGGKFVPARSFACPSSEGKINTVVPMGKAKMWSFLIFLGKHSDTAKTVFLMFLLNVY